MFYNFRYPVVLFILSFIGMLIGWSFRAMNWPGGQLISGSMIMVQVFSIAWLIIILLRGKSDE